MWLLNIFIQLLMKQIIKIFAHLHILIIIYLIYIRDNPFLSIILMLSPWLDKEDF